MITRDTKQTEQHLPIFRNKQTYMSWLAGISVQQGSREGSTGQAPPYMSNQDASNILMHLSIVGLYGSIFKDARLQWVVGSDGSITFPAHIREGSDAQNDLPICESLGPSWFLSSVAKSAPLKGFCFFFLFFNSGLVENPLVGTKLKS